MKLTSFLGEGRPNGEFEGKEKKLVMEEGGRVRRFMSKKEEGRVWF